MRMTRQQVVASGIALVLIAGAVAVYAAFVLTGTGTQTVNISVSSGMFSECDVNGNPSACAGVGSPSITYTLPTLTTEGAINSIHVTVQNTGNQGEYFSANANTFPPTQSVVQLSWSPCYGGGDGCSPGGSPPMTAPGGSADFTFTITAQTSGTVNVNINVGATP